MEAIVQVVNGGLAAVVKREPYLFDDHCAFVGKQIKFTTGDQWLREAVGKITNGGSSYFLTRGKKTCIVTNREYEVWSHVKTEHMMATLDLNVSIENPDYDEKVGKLYAAKIKGGKEEPTADEIKYGVRFNFTTFSNHRVKARGFIATQISTLSSRRGIYHEPNADAMPIPRTVARSTYRPLVRAETR